MALPFHAPLVIVPTVVRLLEPANGDAPSVLYDTVMADAPLKVAPDADPAPPLLNVTELATEPAEPSMATPVRDCDPLARFSAMAVVPTYSVELPRTPEGIVPVSCPAGTLVKPEAEPLNEVAVSAPVEGLYCNLVEDTYSVVSVPVVVEANSG